MISSDVMRGYNDMLILSILIDGDSYGYEISKRIKEISKEKYSIKETTLYSAFVRLEKNGYVTSYSGEKTHGKKRTYYKLTEKGLAYYLDKCREWVLTKEVVNKFVRGNQDEYHS